MKLTPTHKPKAIITDVDKTLTERTTWYELTEQLGADSSEHAKIFSQFNAGKIEYQQMKDELFKLWLAKGPVSKKKLETIFADVHLKGEAFATFSELQERGYELCLISSSLDLFVESVAKRFDIKHWYANSKLIFDENDNWVDFEYDKNECELKKTQLEDFLKKTGLNKEDCVALGDSRNDTGIFSTIPGIAIHTDSDHLKELAWQEARYLPKVIQLIESI